MGYCQESYYTRTCGVACPRSSKASGQADPAAPKAYSVLFERGVHARRRVGARGQFDLSSELCSRRWSSVRSTVRKHNRIPLLRGMHSTTRDL
eukprot:6173274-Pleurochrysis_carterae.AAC.1